MDKIEGAHKFGAQRRKRIRYMNRELNKINEKIKESEKVLENSATKLNHGISSFKKIQTHRENDS